MMIATTADLLQVVSERQAAELCCVALVTMRRMRKAGTAPRHLALSERRIGYRLRDIKQWQESRLQGTTTE